MADDKHVNYFALEKACEKSGCPLCTIISERIDRYIDGMLFEHISDRTFRRLYREAGGFCDTHAKKLISFRDGLAVAILTRGTLEEYIADFKKKKMRKYKGKCPVCIQREMIEKDFLTFLAQKHEKEIQDGLQDFFTKSDGLCVQHYAQLIKYNSSIQQWVRDFHECKFVSLHERVSRFIEFSAWGRQSDFETLSEKDKLVWKELAKEFSSQVDG